MFETNHLKSLRFGLLFAIASILVCQFGAFTPSSNLWAQAQSPSNLDNITLGPRFAPNPLEVRGVGGGATLVKDLVNLTDTPTGSCTGYTSTEPNHTLVLTSFFDSLSLLVQSSEDTALVIKGPGGIWCNDDYQGKDPGVSGQWLAGTYRIWVTSYAKNNRPAYTLKITEGR